MTKIIVWVDQSQMLVSNPETVNSDGYQITDGALELFDGDLPIRVYAPGVWRACIMEDEKHES